MLGYAENAKSAQALANYYSSKLGDNLLNDFMLGKTDINSSQDAQRVIDGFWKMTDLSIIDNDNDATIEGIHDIEFWMYKLFNVVNGYMNTHGFEKEWDKASSER